MTSDIALLIRSLQQSKLSAGCPHCGDEFKLAESILFDGTKKFPREAEKIRQEWEKNLDKELELLKKRQIRADEGAEKKAIEVGVGKIIEKVLPAYKNFKLPLADCRFLAEPIDMIVFEGASENKIIHITFLDIKTGNAALNKHQRQIHDAVKDHQVKSEVI
jgi:predicted Holliday junction resolvase-like endonuclease